MPRRRQSDGEHIPGDVFEPGIHQWNSGGDDIEMTVAIHIREDHPRVTISGGHVGRRGEVSLAIAQSNPNNAVPVGDGRVRATVAV